MRTIEEINAHLDKLFADLALYPHSQAISDAISSELEALRELQEEEEALCTIQ